MINPRIVAGVVLVGLFSQVESPGKDASTGGGQSMRGSAKPKAVETPVAEKVRKDGDGPSRQGALLSDSKSCPEGSVLIDNRFCMDLFEYPNLRTGQPVIGRTWKQAVELCEAEGKRLCTESEWELACASGEGREYPYGAAYDGKICNTQSRTIHFSGSNSDCKSAYGPFDLSGNVYEWTASNWSPRFNDKVVKGGNWNAGSENSKCRARFGQPAKEASKAIGFRCCSGFKP
jgi:eukaryotic-like serine/threonine-protein kinase